MRIYSITADSVELTKLIATELELTVLYTEKTALLVNTGMRLIFGIITETKEGLEQFDALVDYVCNIHAPFGKIIWRY